jgi:PAS domain S-box-containing protein
MRMERSLIYQLIERKRPCYWLLTLCAAVLVVSLVAAPDLLPVHIGTALLLGVCGGLAAARHELTKVFPSSGGPLSHISEQQEHTRAALQQYESLVKNLAASVVIRDARGSVIYCSPYTEVLTGYALSEISSGSEDFFLQIVHEEDREKLLRALQINAAGEPFQFRCRYFHKSGIEMWYETRTVPVVSQDGIFLFSLSVTIDVTATVRSQKQIEERNKDLQDFTYMISHDLKAPLFTLKGMVGVLREDVGPGLSTDAVETLRHIEQATQRLEQLVTSILEYSRVSVQEVKAEAVDLNAVLQDVMNDYAMQQHTAQAQCSVASDLPHVIGERIKVYQIFSNLVGNALKYRDPARPLHIEITEKPSRFSRSVLISVKDNGIGIPNEKMPTLFRPFQRGATHVEGLGIGLACVKKLAEKLGGKVEAQSEAGQGTEFVITLRRAAKVSTNE